MNDGAVWHKSQLDDAPYVVEAGRHNYFMRKIR
jgi:hypothetical protein